MMMMMMREMMRERREKAIKKKGFGDCYRPSLFISQVNKIVFL